MIFLRGKAMAWRLLAHLVDHAEAAVLSTREEEDSGGSRLERCSSLRYLCTSRVLIRI